MRHIPLIWEYVAHNILEISSVSQIDMINIVAHYTSLLTGEKDHEELLRLRGFNDEQIRLMSAKRKTPTVTTMGLVFSKPLVKFKYSLLGYALLLVDNYEKGNLPYPGSVSEQPAQVMEIISLIQSIKTNFQQAQNGKRL